MATDQDASVRFWDIAIGSTKHSYASSAFLDLLELSRRWSFVDYLPTFRSSQPIPKAITIDSNITLVDSTPLPTSNAGERKVQFDSGILQRHGLFLVDCRLFTV